MTIPNLEAYAAGNAPIINTPLSNTGYRGLVTSYDYFGTTNEVRVTQSNAGADPRVTKLTLDRLDRVTKSVTPAPLSGTSMVIGEQLEAGGYVTRYEYDFLSNPTKVIDALNNQTVTSYDLLNRVTKFAQPHPTTAGATFDTLFSYTAQPQGWKISTTSPALEVVDTQTDLLGRVVRVSGATPTQLFAYWTDGKLKSTTDQRSRVTDYNYDLRGRLTSVVAPPPATGGSRSTTSYQYTVDSLNQKR